LPRLLASVPAAAASASSLPTIRPIPAESAARILVIIPTRDEAAMLERSITTLRETARYPERVSVLIVDNRSVEPATSATIERLTRIDAVDSFSLDEPFNWPRCNNLAARHGEYEILVFANNDIEMLTPGWDESVRRLLARPDVGVLGARLLYPDGGVQHAGILLGGWQGRPSHDGLWASAEDEGPLNRWTSTRATAAVTGAFMACRRDTFFAVGGFDERLAIAYNDIDFCLKVRKQGLKVMFAGDIELVHYESRTRGHNDSAEKVAWDDAELADMHARWGSRLFQDPGYNPQWVNAVNRPYDGISDLPMRRVLDHLDASAQADPWAIS
jgi:GT2 family glycosyltransferase